MTIMKKVFDTVAHVMPDRERDKLTDQHRYLGKPIDRLDGYAKVTGTATFSAEYRVRGLVHAALVFSTISKGVIKNIDIAAAEQAPGVIKIITHLNAPPMKVPKPLSAQGEPSAGATEVKILNFIVGNFRCGQLVGKIGGGAHRAAVAMKRAEPARRPRNQWSARCG